MDSENLAAIATVLEATTPYGIVAVLGWAYFKLAEKKDCEIKKLNQRVVALAEKQTAALIKVEAALVALRSAIEGLARK